MSLVNCSDCNKEISSNAKVCIHCGNPLVNIEHQKEYKSYYDLSEKEKAKLRKEFNNRAKTWVKKFSSLGLVILCIIKTLFWLIAIITSLAYIPLIKNFGFYFLIVCVIDFVLSYIWINKGIKNSEEDFDVWLSVSKQIKK